MPCACPRLCQEPGQESVTLLAAVEEPEREGKGVGFLNHKQNCFSSGKNLHLSRLEGWGWEGQAGVRLEEQGIEDSLGQQGWEVGGGGELMLVSQTWSWQPWLGKRVPLPQIWQGTGFGWGEQGRQH